MINQIYSFKHRFFILLALTGLLALILYVPTFINLLRPALNVYTFSDTLNPSAVAKFEQIMGIKVNVKFYDTPGEFFTELKARNGKGYDVLLATNYSVELLIKEKLIQQLDTKKISHINQVDDRLKGKYFDPHNLYTVPFAWSVIGIGYDSQKIPHFSKASTWQAIFDPLAFNPTGYKVNVTDDYLEMIFLTSIYLFGTVDSINEKLPFIQKVLKKQKPWVENYTGGNQKYLLKGEVTPLLIAESAVMKKLMSEEPRFCFVVPREGSLYTIENCAISASCKKVDLAHAFINFMISERIGLLTWQNGYNPSNIMSYRSIEKRFITDKSFFPDRETFKKLHLITNKVSLKKVEEMWLQIKLA